MRFQKVAKVMRHRLEIGSDDNPILPRSQSQNSRIIDSLQFGLFRGPKVHRWFPASATTDDTAVEAGIRQKTNHGSASPRWHLPSHALKLLFDFGSWRVRLAELFFLALALCDILLHFFVISKVEGDRAVHLLECQRRVVQPDGFGRFTSLELSYDMCQRYTASAQVEASLPELDEFLSHDRPFIQSIVLRVKCRFHFGKERRFDSH